MIESLKSCCRCGNVFPLSEFYRDKRRKDGRYPRCRRCHAEAVRRWRDNNLEKARANDRQWKARNPDKHNAWNKRWQRNNAEKVRAWTQRWKEENPEKRSAHTIVASAIKRGALVRAPCLICGNEDADGHHDNYARPLDVVWLCRSHHIERHHSLAGCLP